MNRVQQRHRQPPLVTGLPVPPSPSAGTAFEQVPFVVVDVETTGGSATAGHRVTEVAAVIVEGGIVRDAFHTLVNPQRSIPPFIVSLTGIDNAMVQSAPVFDVIAGALAAELAGRVFVAHNAKFDWGFLSAEFRRALPSTLEGTDPLGQLASAQLCTVRLARRLLTHLPRRNLDALCWHYGVRVENRHRAAGDARATAQVLLALLRDAERQGVYTFEALQQFLAGGTAAARRRRSAAPAPTDGAEGA